MKNIKCKMQNVKCEKNIFHHTTIRLVVNKLGKKQENIITAVQKDNN